MKKKFLAYVIAALFFLIIITPIITANYDGGGELAIREKRYLAPKPILFREDGHLNPNVFQESVKWFEDHFGMREHFVRLGSEFIFHVLGQSPSPKVHIGKNGWYYYNADDNLEIATGQYQMREDLLEKILNTHLVLKEKLAEKGIEYIIVLPTSKVSIYPENMLLPGSQLRRTPVDMVADYLEQNSDLKVVRLKKVLLDEKPIHQAFLKNDTHWTQAGAYAAYKEIVTRMADWGVCQTQPAAVEYVDGEYVGEFGPMMGIDLSAEKVLNTKIVEPAAIENGVSDRYQRLQEITAQEGIQRYCYYENPDVSGPRVALFGDSMFSGWNLPQLMGESFPMYAYIWDYNIREQILEELEIDVVIFEATERNLRTVPTVAQDLLFSRLDAPDATITGCQVEDSILSVTVKNTGRQPWSYVNQVKLGLFVDDKDTGIRVLLPDVKKTEAGQEVLFSIDLSDSGLSADGVSVQMLQEGVQYFGQRRSTADMMAE